MDSYNFYYVKTRYNFYSNPAAGTDAKCCDVSVCLCVAVCAYISESQSELYNVF